MSNILPYAPNVPLLNQPILVLGWAILVNVRCQCEQPSVLMLAIKQTAMGLQADLGICPGCARPMHIQNFRLNAQEQLEFGISLEAPLPTPKPATES